MNPPAPTAAAVQHARDLAEEMARLAARCDLRPQDRTWVADKTATILDLAAQGNVAWTLAVGFFLRDCERVVRECRPLEQGLDVLRARETLRAFAWVFNETLHGHRAALQPAEREGASP